MQADFARNCHCIKVDAGSKFEDLSKPEVWVHIAKTFRPGDIIEVRPKDGEWFGELYVRSVTKTDVRTHPIRFVSFAAKVEKPSVPGYTIKHRGPRGWSVIRDSDKTVVFENGQTRQKAEEWLALTKG